MLCGVWAIWMHPGAGSVAVLGNKVPLGPWKMKLLLITNGAWSRSDPILNHSALLSPPDPSTVQGLLLTGDRPLLTLSHSILC